MFLFASRTDTFGQVILEAQASGLPVVAVDEGGPASLIADGRTGLLCPRRRGRARRRGGAAGGLADDPARGSPRRRSTRCASAAGSRSLGQLADG